MEFNPWASALMLDCVELSHHLLHAVHHLLEYLYGNRRREQFHLSGKGKQPTIKRGAKVNRYRHLEMLIVYDFGLHLFPKTIYDVFHHIVVA